MSDTTGINKALERERTKLQRQLESIKATEALIAMLEAELGRPIGKPSK